MGIVRTVVFASVALMLTLFTWLGGGIVPAWLTPWVPWLTLLIAETALLLPEQKRSETLFDARDRVGRGLLRDPLTWLMLALTAFLTLQWLNACTFLEWDVARQQWNVVSPAFEWLRHPNTATSLAIPPLNPAQPAFRPLDGAPFPWLPWCLRADEAKSVLAWFPPVLVAMLAVRHALLARTQRHLAAFVCIMTSVLAVAGIVQYLMEGEFLYWGMKSNAFFFATFGYPNQAACFFPAVMALSVGMLLWTVEYREHTRIPLWVYAVSAVLCGASGILSGSRAGMIFTLAVAGFTVLFIPFRYFSSWPARLRWAIPAALLLGAIVVGGTAAFRVYAIQANAGRATALRLAKTPEERTLALQRPSYPELPAVDGVLREISETDWAAFFEHPMLMRSGYQGILALRQFADHPWAGSGAWSFRWINVRYIDRDNPEERQWLSDRTGVGQANVHNDTLQFLAEHGWIGFGLMLGCVAALFIPFLKTLITSPSHTVSDAQADRCWLNRLNVYGVFALVATTMIAFHSFIDLVFRSPACMMLYGLLFVCAPGFVIGRRAVHTPSPKELSHA